MTITITHLGLPAGQYRLQVVGDDPNGVSAPTWSNTSFDTFDFDLGGPYIVNVVPEPASLALILLGGASVLMRRRKA
jgi:hypothetical protein